MVNSTYLSGEVEAQCLSDAIYDLIIWKGARPADDPDPTWQVACVVTTRGQAKNNGEHTPLKAMPSSYENAVVNRDMQSA